MTMSFTQNFYFLYLYIKVRRMILILQVFLFLRPVPWARVPPGESVQVGSEGGCRQVCWEGCDAMQSVEGGSAAPGAAVMEHMLCAPSTPDT